MVESSWPIAAFRHRIFIKRFTFTADRMTLISCLIKLLLVVFLTSGISKTGRGQTNTGKPQSSVPVCSLEQLGQFWSSLLVSLNIMCSDWKNPFLIHRPKLLIRVFKWVMAVYVCLKMTVYMQASDHLRL